MPPCAHTPFVAERRQVNEAHRLKRLRRYVSSQRDLALFRFCAGVPGITPCTYGTPYLKYTYSRYLQAYPVSARQLMKRPPAFASL